MPSNLELRYEQSEQGDLLEPAKRWRGPLVPSGGRLLFNPPDMMQGEALGAVVQRIRLVGSMTDRDGRLLRAESEIDDSGQLIRLENDARRQARPMMLQDAITPELEKFRKAVEQLARNLQPRTGCRWSASTR